MTTKVFVTGGSGFLGRGILRRIAQNKLDWDVTVYARAESKLADCQHRYPFARYILGDIRDYDRLALAMAGHDYAVHAAAQKRIPEAELAAMECVAVNVDGSRNVLRAARETNIARCVGISSDKACQPVNVYGMSKAIMERLFADTAQFGDTQFCCVRYGNVVGSTGSVIPLFQRQFAELGRVQVTNPSMTRFWMSVGDAIDLILTALVRCRPGAVAVPPAHAMRIVDVARAATQDDVEVEVIGERAGEKSHELLVHHEESVRVVRHDNPHFYELLPPGQQVGESAFTIASHSAVLMKPAQMRELIKDAVEV